MIGVAFAEGKSVLAEGHIQFPVRAVLNGPVPAENGPYYSGTVLAQGLVKSFGSALKKPNDGNTRMNLPQNRLNTGRDLVTAGAATRMGDADERQRAGASGGSRMAASEQQETPCLKRSPLPPGNFVLS